ncbi:Dual specificity mitogen-activated protein kinase kinase 5 [Holothuria leucospilota]|uniref:mitogen-activated protein kinase kinase n=1 Tax=Holothuria leucospilota TaxID=206669 RepID=A0A9Q1H2J8_HOLLE|nr:Dual specificity mitogen-activated protein kinase kinase 5 [Holothuria leucospilota]
MASNKQPIVVRIKTQHGEDMDWTMSSPNTRFQEVMGVVAQVLQDHSASAFEYEDEDGDRITVRGDAEMEAMMAYYLQILYEYEERRIMAPPLCIYPKMSRGSKKSGPGLTVNTRPMGPVPQGADSGISLQYAKHEAELREILARGRIAESDIHKIQMLGRGQSGTVWKALHVPTNTEMAIKVIELDVTPAARKQIMSELQVLYKCDCPVIISYYGSFFKENQISICTEFMDGGSLEVYSPIPEKILGRIAVSVVKGLNYLWNLKILHRDIKPSNILVNTRGDVKLCDFGVSTQLINSIAQTYIGTNAYMAPERVLGHGYGVHSEVWSVGLFLLEMATGRFPYPVAQKGNDLAPIALLQCILNEMPPRLSSEQFTPQFSEFVASCMEKEPSKRPSPEAVLLHPFIRMYDDNNKQLIGCWVYSHLQAKEGVVS